MKYSGIDLHSNNSVVTVTDESDRIVAEKRLPNDIRKIVDFLMPWRAELVGVVVESTYNWYWLVDGLQACGFQVHLANTGAIKKYDGLKQAIAVRTGSSVCCDHGPILRPLSLPWHLRLPVSLMGGSGNVGLRQWRLPPTSF